MADTHCDWVRRELAEVRRGRAADDVARRVETHLAGCAACRAEADWDARLGDVLASATGPRDMESRVKLLVHRRRRLRRWAGGVAAAAVIGVAGLALFDLPPTPRQAATGTGDAVVMKELAGVMADSPVVRLRADDQQEMLLAELTLLAQGDIP